MYSTTFNSFKIGPLNACIAGLFGITIQARSILVYHCPVHDFIESKIRFQINHSLMALTEAFASQTRIKFK